MRTTPCATTRPTRRRKPLPNTLVVRLVVFILFIVKAALADPAVLLIVEAGVDQDPAPYELRLRSEFASEGFEVVTASSRSKQSLLDLEGLARRTGAVAGLSVMVDAQSIDGRLWVIDPSSRVDLVRTIRVSRTEGDPVAVFALRAVEALRGARLELEHQKRKLSSAGSANPDASAGPSSRTPSAASTSDKALAGSGAAPAEKKAASGTPPPRDRTTKNAKASGRPNPPDRAQPLRWLLQVNGALGWELNGLGALWGPGIELRRTLAPRFSAGLSFDGPLYSRLTPREGTVVHVNQELLGLHIRWTPLRADVGSLELAAITGVSRFAVRGQTEAPTQGASGVIDQGFGWIGGAGIGLGVQVSRRIRIGMEVQWLRRLPAPVVLEFHNNRYRRLTGDTDSLLLGKLGLGVMF